MNTQADTTSWNLAQMNVATARFAPDDPRMEPFMSRLDGVNALADSQPGFVWRLQSDSGNATDIDAGGGPMFLVNMSVWESIEALSDFVYKTVHKDVMLRRREWFEKSSGAHQVLWWVEAGHTPTVEEGLERLARLDKEGPSQQAFSFAKPFPPPDPGS
ncbi:MAG: DUF3291 domain-containing protein [Woeseiaceae bacterium]|nr:DUF3291 domain-containing protein [Woeseiaceae bacterium]